MASKIILLATGGTIATMADLEKGGLVARLDGETLLRNANITANVEVRNFATLNSTYLTPVHMFELANTTRELLQQEDVQGVVITHGTSTMEETAFILDLLVTGPKPVVITGAQRAPAEDWPDGPANLAAAIRVASSPLARGQGVMVVFCEKIYEGREISKVHTTSLDAFSSGEKGLLGYVYPDRIVFNRTRERRILELSSLKDYSVEIIKFYAGADEKFFLAAIEQGVKGLIVEGVGLGNVNEPFYRGIRKAREKGLEVVITSRCSYGRVVPKYGYPGGGLSLENLGVIFGGHLSSPKARLLLMMGLSKELAHEELQDLFVYFTI